jgi:hypothetical protein
MDEPSGWKEPFVRGLWSYDMLFGAPRFLLWITMPLGTAAVLLPSQNALIWMACVQAVGVALTKLEPEWATIFRDFIKDDGEVEP